MPRQPKNYVQKLMQYNKRQGTWITPKPGSRRYYEVVGQSLPKPKPLPKNPNPISRPIPPRKPPPGLVYKQKRDVYNQNPMY